MNFGMNRPEWGGSDDFGRRRPGRGGRGRGDFEGGAEDFGPRAGHGPFGHGRPGSDDEPQGGGRRGGGRRGGGRRGGPGAGFGFGPPGMGEGFPPMPPFPPMAFGPGRGRPGHGAHGGRARRGDVRLAILALLAEEALNGYQIIQALAERTSGAWKPSPGAVYPALSQLTDEGLIAPTEVEGQKAFTLTDAGREAADAIETKPWEAVNEANAPVDAEGAAAFWPEFGQLAMAARTVAATGSPAQLAAALEAVSATRRKLYAILAEENDEGTTR